MMNWIISGGALAAIALVWRLYKLWVEHGKKAIADMILLLVIEAEKYLGSGTGQLKMEWVLARVHAMIPKPLKPFISEAELKNMIERAVAFMKEVLEANSADLLGAEEEALLKSFLEEPLSEHDRLVPE